MAVGPFIPHNVFIEQVFKQNLDFLNSTVEALLLDNAHNPDVAGHTVLADITPDEIGDADYSRQTLTGKTVAQDAQGRTVIDADNPDFGDAVSISARYLYLVVNTGTPSTSYIIGYMDLNEGGSSNVDSQTANFDPKFSSEGIYRITP